MYSAELLLASPSTWFIAGVILIALELILPGLVSVFLGIASLLTGIAIQQQWVSNLSGAVLAFLLLSTVLLLFVRSLVARFVPATVLHSETDETKLTLYQTVQVTETIPAGAEGRIVVRGSSWKARFASGSQETAEKGSQVTIIGQDNLTYIVATDQKTQQETQK